MRDKVKRFISILMTALMLVNLLPVGALADGITSIGYKPEVAASTGNYTVYVYARFDGDPLPGVTLNASQWYTIGYIANVNLPSPGGISWWQYWYYNNNNYCGSTINSTSASGIIGGLVQEYNKSIVIKSDEWISANFKACPGADTYMEGTSEPAWHLDIIVDINKNPPVHNLVYKVNNTNGKTIGTTKKITGKWTNPLSFNTYTKENPVPETIIDEGRIYRLKERWEGNPNLNTKIYFNEPIKNVEFYYKDMGPVNRNYTVNYYLNGTTTKVKDSETGTAALGEIVTPTTTEVTGYTLVPGQETSLTIGDGNNVLDLYYTKNSYNLKINYEYEDGSEAAASHEEMLPYQSDYSVTSPDITGYTADNSVVSGTMPANDVAVTVTYKPQTNLSYTVNYYWNGTEIPVKPSKTVLHQTFGAEATESPIGADDYTPESNEPKKIKIGADSTQNVINFYYYRNVKLTANSDAVTYDGNDRSVFGFTGAPKEADFSAIKVGAMGKDFGTYPAAFAEDTVGTVDKTEKYIVTKTTDGQLVIEKRNVTLTSETASKPYDGKPLTKPEVQIEGSFVDGEVLGIVAQGKVTHVSEGEVTNTIFFNRGDNFKESNYNIVMKEGKLWITGRTDEVVVEIEGRTKTVTYNGEEHTAWQYDVISISDPLYETAPGGVPNFWNKNAKKAKGTDAGTYPMGWEAADFENTNTNFSNVKFVVTDGQLVINPRPVVLTSGSDSKVYNGEALTKDEVTASTGENEGFVKDQGATYNVTGSQTDVGTSNNTFTYELNSNTKAGNYEITKTEGTLEVTPVTDRVTVKIKGKTDSVMYDGKPHFVFGFDAEPSNKLYNPNKDMWFNGTDADMIAEGTDAGTYTMGLEVSDFTNKSDNFTNVEFIVTDGYVKINPRSVTLTSASDEKVYDGKPLTNETVAVGGDGFADGEGATYDFTGSQTDVGESKNVFTFEVNANTNKDNYTFEVAIGTLKVNPVTDKVTVTVTEKSDTVTYDGKEHIVSGYESMTADNPLYDEDSVEENPTVMWAAKGTNVGEYPVGIVAGDFKNTNANFTNVEFVVVDGALEITPAPVTLQAPIASKTYDGTPLKAEDYGHSFVEGLDFADDFASISVEGSQTQAGSSVSQIKEVVPKKGKDLKNYKLTFLPGSLTVTKRSVLITSQSATKTYDGSALTRPAVTITGDGFVPGELAKAEATGSITNVGSTPNAIQYTTTGAFNAANYSIALSVGTLTVTEKPKPEPRRTFNLTINYVYQNGKRAAASYNRGGLKNGETFDITSPVIAGYTASETVVSGTIYNRDIKVTVIYTADGVNLDDYGVPLGLGNITMNVGDCFE